MEFSKANGEEGGILDKKEGIKKFRTNNRLDNMFVFDRKDNQPVLVFILETAHTKITVLHFIGNPKISVLPLPNVATEFRNDYNLQNEK